MSVWEARDLPVLLFLSENPSDDGMLWTHQLSDQPRSDLPQLSELDFLRSVQTLRDADYVDWSSTSAEGGGTRFFSDFQVTGAGKQVLGLWPRFDALGSPGELASVLEALAEDAATEEERSNLQRAAGAVRRTGPEVVRSALVGVLSGLARTQLGI